MSGETTRYAGADWIKDCFKVEMSPLGRKVADFLGQLFKGIYHLNNTSLSKVDWKSERHIEFTLDRPMSTFDNDLLTELVVLSHDQMLRVELSGVAPGYIKMVFHKRKARDGRMYERMPDLDSHVEEIRRRQ